MIYVIFIQGVRDNLLRSGVQVELVKLNTKFLHHFAKTSNSSSIVSRVVTFQSSSTDNSNSYIVFREMLEKFGIQLDEFYLYAKVA